MQERPSLLAAASGIGRATALIFAREGANVVCADINEKGADETAAEVNRKGSRALAIKVDVTKRTEVDDMVECAIAAFGGVQFLFNSAGAAIRPAKFLEIDDTLMEKSFALNVNGTSTACKLCCRICSPAARRHRQYGEHGAPPWRPGLLIHCAAAKGAVVSMTLGAAREFATQGIRALSISPGRSKRLFQSAAQSSPELIKQFLSDVPMQRFGQPEEIGELVLFICSDACEFMTADTIYVNGGGGWR